METRQEREDVIKVRGRGGRVGVNEMRIPKCKGEGRGVEKNGIWIQKGAMEKRGFKLNYYGFTILAETPCKCCM